MSRLSTLIHGFAGAYLRQKAPLFLSYALTHRCNCRCGYCALPKTPVSELSFEEVAGIIDQFAKLGLSRISLTGGEPLLYPDFDRVVAHLVERRITVSCNTNGLLIPAKLDSLKKISAVAVSIDGPKTAHDSVRGRGNFDQAIEGVSLLQKHGVPVTLLAVLSGHNIDEIDGLVETAQKLGTPFAVQPVQPTLLGSYMENADLPTVAQMQSAIRRLIEKKKAGAPVLNSVPCLQHFMTWPQGHDIGCLAGRLTYRLEPDGMLTHCERMPNESLPWIDLKTMPVKQAIERLPAAGCDRCYCAGQVELQLARNLKPAAMWGLLRRTGKPGGGR